MDTFNERGLTSQEQALRRAQAYNATLTRYVYSLIETTKAKGAPNAPTLIAACEKMLREALKAARTEE